MSPTLEEAIGKFRANETEAGRQILISMLNEDPRNDEAWKYLIDSYPDLDFQTQLANEYFNLTSGSLKATQMLLRLEKLKNERYVRLEAEDRKWNGKLKMLDQIPWLGRIQWTKTLLVKVIVGLVVFILLTYALWIGTSINASVRTHNLQSDFDRLSGVFSEQVLEHSKLSAQYTELETQYSTLQTQYTQLSESHQTLLQAYQTLADSVITP
jgi:hypothetical protein